MKLVVNILHNKLWSSKARINFSKKIGHVVKLMCVFLNIVQWTCRFIHDFIMIDTFSTKDARYEGLKSTWGAKSQRARGTWNTIALKTLIKWGTRARKARGKWRMRALVAKSMPGTSTQRVRAMSGTGARRTRSTLDTRTHRAQGKQSKWARKVRNSPRCTQEMYLRPYQASKEYS